MKRTRKSLNLTEEKGRLHRSSSMSSNVLKDFSDLPRDLAEEVLSKVPVTSLRRVRSTCKTWNTLSRCKSFAKKHIGQERVAAAKEKEFVVVMMLDFKVYLMRVNLEGGELCMNRQGTLVSPDDPSDQIDVRHVSHCDGLLLCVLRDNPRLLVFNPYWGQPRWILTRRNKHLNAYSYALGYSSSTKSYKILSFVIVDYCKPNLAELIIYDLNSSSSSSWRALDFTRDWNIFSVNRGVSLKGNTYWFAEHGYPKDTPPLQGGDLGFLLCFDFTREAFGPRLPLPFMWCIEDRINVSVVRDEQLAVLYQCVDTFQMEIWVTTKIEPNAVSWGTKLFLSADMRALTGGEFMFSYFGASFFIDEEKKVAVVFDKSNDRMRRRNAAYIIGEDGSSLKQVDLGESPNKHVQPLVCSYVPTSVLLE